MYWTLELASKLEDAPWPATRDELLDWALRTGAQEEIIENLQEIEDEGEIYERIEDLWPDYPTKDDFFFHEDEYKLVNRLINNKLKRLSGQLIASFRVQISKNIDLNDNISYPIFVHGFVRFTTIISSRILGAFG